MMLIFQDSEGNTTDTNDTEKPGIFDLPEEIFHHVVSFLSLSGTSLNPNLNP